MLPLPKCFEGAECGRKDGLGTSCIAAAGKRPGNRDFIDDFVRLLTNPGRSAVDGLR